MTCAVIIPVYKTQPSRTDLLSIEQTLKVLHPRHEVYYLAPEGMDLSAYPPAGVMEAPSKFFTGRKSYSELCCRPELYEALAGYDYMLIMQHDGWVFRDDLDEFMNLNYDYIGAPIIVGAWKFERPLIGNGGVSLRRVQTFIKVCRCYGPRSTEYHPEDVFFCVLRRPLLIMAPNEVAARFSLEHHPEKYEQLLHHQLPMFCHRPWDLGYYDSYWKQYIPI